MLKIISGGQTGADEAGLLAAYDLGFPVGGTAPKGYRIKNYDGTNGSNLELKTKFGLKEDTTENYDSRTKQNILDSDATVWFGYPESSGGKLTINTCESNNKHIIINPSVTELTNFIKLHNIKILNVSGNALTEYNPNIMETTYFIMKNTLSIIKNKNLFYKD